MRIDVTCPNCKHNTVVGPANSEVVIFEKAIALSFFYVICQRPQCDHRWYTFIGEDYRDIKAAVNWVVNHPQEWDVEIHDTPTQTVWEEYAEASGGELVVAHELTSSEQKQVEFFHFLLERGTNE